MPHLKVMNEPYKNADAVEKVVNYVTDHSLYIGSATASINPMECIFQMFRIKELYGKLDGRQIRHFMLCFNCKYECISYGELEQLGAQIASYYDNTYQVIWAIHEKHNHAGELLRHLHFAFNTVSYIDGRMYREGIEDILRLYEFISARLPDGVGLLEWSYSKSDLSDRFF